MNRLEEMKKRLERLSALMEDYEFACTMGEVPQSGFEADFAKRQFFYKRGIVMTREEARKSAEVMMAYADGKDVEFRPNGKDWDILRGDDYDQLSFRFDLCEYRIKKEPTYRPFKNSEECWAEMQKHQPFGWLIDKNTKVYHSIVALNNICPYFSNDCGDEYEHLFECAAFADGTPFGIKEE